MENKNLSEKDRRDHAKEVEELANPNSMLKELAKQEHETKHAKKRATRTKKIVTQVPVTQSAPIPKQKTAYELSVEEGNKIVHGRFRNIESPGSPLHFNYNMTKYELWDGVEYDLPLKVARHLNNCRYIIHENALATDGLTRSAKVGKWVDRFAFDSLVYSSDQQFGSQKRIYEPRY
jgi:hypothetical protein